MTTAATGTAATTGTAQPASAKAASAQTALGGLASNFQDFLSLLMTQLKNQDPTSPLDTNQFTQELVQFTSVEQQINTNSSLTQLIQLTQGGQMLQAAGIVGHEVEVSSAKLVLQNATGGLRFQAPVAGPVSISIYNAQGGQIASAQVTAQQGSNDWTWNGDGSNGSTYPDGAYAATVSGTSTSGASTVLPFTVLGKATGVQSNGTMLQLDLGQSVFNLSDLKSIVS